MPWWNEFEGAGAPLAGEMQSSPFYPLMPLLLLPHGQVLIQVAIQILSGLATLALLRKLRVSPAGAVLGALLFEVNGTIAWLSGADCYPAPCLPIAIYGIEALRGSERSERIGGILLLALSIAISISAGFIEVSFLNFILVLAWATLRLRQSSAPVRVRFAASFGAAGFTALLLAAPILLAFFDYLAVGDVGGIHTGETARSLVLPGLVQKLAPYVWGPIFYFDGGILSVLTWGNTGGYVGFALPVLAIVATFGTRERGLRWLLAAWIVVSVGTTFGMPVVQKVALLFPGVKYTAYYRYLDTSWEFALAILAAFAVDDALALGWPELRKRCLVAVGLVGAVAVASFLGSLDLVSLLLTRAGYSPWLAASVVAATLLGGAILLSNRFSTATWRAVALGAIALAEAFAAYLVPTLTYPLDGTVAMGGVNFLRAHLGFQRFYSIGPIAPNYGSKFDIASINYNDLPMARSWVDYVHRRLDPYSRPLVFNGTDPRTDPNAPDQESELVRNVAAYEATGVKYVVTSDVLLADALPGARRVYDDAAMVIVELAKPAPYFQAKGCRVEPVSRNEVHTDCDKRSTLTRLELGMPGWSVTVSGSAAPLSVDGEVFQAVKLPAGRSDVRFAFVPPYMEYGYLAFAIGCVNLFALAATGLRRPAAGC